jgi:hypothetical protein
MFSEGYTLVNGHLHRGGPEFRGVKRLTFHRAPFCIFSVLYLVYTFSSKKNFF